MVRTEVFKVKFIILFLFFFLLLNESVRASLNIPFSKEITQISPYESIYIDSNKIYDQIFQKLVTKDENFMLTPQLAKSWSQTGTPSTKEFP